MIEVKNISKKFNNNVVLNGIDLNINKGDVVAIIGPSGTGKSTFLRCLNRLEKPESGSISIGDLSVDLARSDKKSLVELRKKTSMVFQRFNLFSKKTALENVMEGLIIVKKMDKKKEEEIEIRPLIYEMHLTDDQGIFLKLSSGSACNIKPELVLEAFAAYAGFEIPEFGLLIHRKEVYARSLEGNRFVSLESLGEEIG